MLKINILSVNDNGRIGYPICQYRIFHDSLEEKLGVHALKLHWNSDVNVIL